MNENTFLCKKSILPFVKEPVLDRNENPVMYMTKKLSWQPTFHFNVQNKILFSAVLKHAPANPLKKQIIIFRHTSDDKIAVISEKSIHKKKMSFLGFAIEIGVRSYEAKYTEMDKTFEITDAQNNMMVKGIKTDFLRSNFFYNRSYHVEIKDESHEKLLWLAIVKAMQVLK